MNKATHSIHLAISVLACSALLGGCVVAPAYPARVRGNVVIGVAPAPGMIWFDGYWSYGARGRYWVPGYWGRPGHRR